MRALRLCLAVMLIPLSAVAGEKVAGKIIYSKTEYPMGPDSNIDGFNWAQVSYGTFETTKGSLGSGNVECHGYGQSFGRAVFGGGVCIYKNDRGSQVWKYSANTYVQGSWEIIHATGKYSGLKGGGKVPPIPRGEDEKKLTLWVGITDWAGEIEWPR